MDRGRCSIGNTAGARSQMKLVAEYLEQAVQFERLAATEKDPQLKAQFEKQAAAYHRLAAKLATELGVPLPKPENSA